MALTTTLPGANTARKMVMVVGTFAVAMGIGFFMQQRGAEASFNGEAQGAAGSVAGASLASAPALLGTPGSCDPAMAVRVLDAALVELSVAAPCVSDAAFTVHHEGMMFSGRTDGAGAATLIAPALAPSAVFIAAFDDGLGAIAEAQVPQVDAFDRVVLQWRGQGGFEIHAMEYGANYGEEGHVWDEAPRTASEAAEGNGGFVMVLGDGRVDVPRFAQVYTFPTGDAPKAGRVALSVEAEITEANCASDIEAQTLERAGASSGLKIVDLTLSVPACEAIGDFLVLKNILSDLTVSCG